VSETDSNCCEIFCFNETKVRKVQASLASLDVPNMVKLFKVLADETRMKIICALCEEDELCVCDVANIIGSTTATASHHLRTLKRLGFAKDRKEGKLVFYSLEDDHVRQLVHLVSNHSQG
jgi:DNA-binding transcriptional ArsR family regulator